MAVSVATVDASSADLSASQVFAFDVESYLDPVDEGLARLPLKYLHDAALDTWPLLSHYRQDWLDHLTFETPFLVSHEFHDRIWRYRVRHDQPWSGAGTQLKRLFQHTHLLQLPQREGRYLAPLAERWLYVPRCEGQTFTLSAHWQSGAQHGYRALKEVCHWLQGLQDEQPVDASDAHWVAAPLESLPLTLAPVVNVEQVFRRWRRLSLQSGERPLVELDWIHLRHGQVQAGMGCLFDHPAWPQLRDRVTESAWAQGDWLLLSRRDIEHTLSRLLAVY